MKSTLLATAAAVGLLAAPHAAFAAAPDRGFVEVSLAFGSSDDDNNSGNTWFDDPFSYGARTQWLFPLSEPVHIQTDVFFEQSDDIFAGKAWRPGNSTDSQLFGATAHIIHPMEHGRVAVAGSLFALDAHAPNFGPPSYNEGVDYGLVALGGQYFLDHMTLFAQGGWFGVVACDGSEGCVQNGVFFRAKGTYFFTPNSSLGFDGTIFWGDDEYAGDLHGGTAAVEGEYRFDDSRFSGFANVNYAREEADLGFGTGGRDTWTLNIGARLYLDSMSLIDFSQAGPSMNTPTFHHALAVEGALNTEATIGASP